MATLITATNKMISDGGKAATNPHTSANPNGEIRGQVSVKP
jgi:hypothetical protein